MFASSSPTARAILRLCLRRQWRSSTRWWRHRTPSTLTRRSTVCASSLACCPSCSRATPRWSRTCSGRGSESQSVRRRLLPPLLHQDQPRLHHQQQQQQRKSFRTRSRWQSSSSTPCFIFSFCPTSPSRTPTWTSTKRTSRHQSSSPPSCGHPAWAAAKNRLPTRPSMTRTALTCCAS